MPAPQIEEPVPRLCDEIDKTYPAVKRILIETAFEWPVYRPPGKRLEIPIHAWQTDRWLMIV